MNYYFFDQLTMWLERHNYRYTSPIEHNPQAAEVHVQWVEALPLIGKVTHDFTFWDFDRLAIPLEQQAYVLQQANAAQLRVVDRTFTRNHWLRLHIPNAITVAVSARAFSKECIKSARISLYAWSGGYYRSLILLNPRNYSLIHEPTELSLRLPSKPAIKWIKTIIHELMR